MVKFLRILAIIVSLSWAQASLDLLATLIGPSSRFGRAVLGGVDINGGGMPDVVVGAYDEDAVYIYYGEGFDDVVDLKIDGENGNWAGDYFGWSLSFCPDLNSDGFPELVVGAPYYPFGAQVGRVYVYYGGPAIDNTPDWLIQNPTGTDAGFGYSLACGNLTGALSEPDIAIGAPYYLDGAKRKGRVYLFVDGAFSPDTIGFEGEGTWDFDLFGYSIAVGRMDGNIDMWEELLVGAPYANHYAGKAYLYLGGGGTDTLPDLVWQGTPGQTDFLGASVAGIGDINGDSWNDLAIGIPYRAAGAINTGEVYVILGKSPQDTTPDFILHGDRTANEYFGICVNSVGDMNGDTQADLGLAAPNWNNGQGRVYLFLSGPFDTIYDGFANNPSSWYTHYGISISSCGDLNGDTLGEMVVGSDGQNSAYLYLGKRDLVPPVIDSVTQLYDTTYVGPFAISAVIYDPNGSILADSLYYNVNNTGWVSAGHDSLLGNRYYFHIPKQPLPAYNATVIKWYLMATDPDNITYSPLQGPNAPYQFRILESSGPSITNTTIWPDTNYLGPYPITCEVTDISGVSSVKLHYRVSDGVQNWLPMFPIGANRYKASIPSQNLGKVISYAIEARDGFEMPNTSYDPKDYPTGYAFCLGTVPKILLVDADGGDSLERYYKPHLDSLGYPFVYWPDAWGSPRYAFENPNKFQCLIWFTGTVASKILNNEEMDSLVSFFNRGGRLFISSQNLGETIGSTPFYQNWLHAQFDNPSHHIHLAHAVPGDSVSDIYKDTIALGGGGGAYNAVSKDRIFPDAFADSVYVCNVTGGSYAIKYADPTTGYKLVYFSVPFEAIDASPIMFAQRGPIMASILRWFGLQPGAQEQKPLSTEPKFSLEPPSPNPFFNRTTIRFQIPSSVAVNSPNSQRQGPRLQIYDATGRLVKSFNPLTNYQSPIIWSGEDDLGRQVPAGIYFVVLESGEKRLKQKAVLLR